jgi:pimeloyl-ACP methyl ester carboxylesterase/DNA-binding winged helix-turn-helix (wHTH) protein
MQRTSREMNGASFPDDERISAFAFGPFRLHLPERSLQRHGIPVPLGGRAFDILVFLVQRAGHIVGHDELIAHVWADVRVSRGTPRVHLTALRKILGCRPQCIRYIANVPGRGYSFVAPDVIAIAVVRQGVSGTDYLIPHGGHDPTDSLVGSQPTLLLQSKSTTGLYETKFALPVQESLLNTAEQLLAILNTDDAQLPGKSRPDREPGPDFGRNSDHATSIPKASLGGVSLGLKPEGEDPEMNRKKLAIVAAITLLTCVANVDFSTASAETPLQTAGQVTHYRTTTIDGLSVFYREAGPSTGPVVVLLHGFPTSSHMFRNLIPTLADRYHVIAPDYPGFGQSAAPDHKQFAYTFAHYASLVDALLQHLGANRYSMYVMDYGAPVGYRLAMLHPERVTALIVQNGNAYAEGLEAFWDPIKAYWADGSEKNRRALDFLVAPETTKFQYTDGVSDVSRINPDNWVHDQALLDRPGNRDIQLDLFHDYGTNVPLYPEFQAFFRKYQPPALIVWGKNDKIFPATGAGPYLRDLPKAELHLLDTGHFALEDKLDVMAPMIRDFLDRSNSPP